MSCAVGAGTLLSTSPPAASSRIPLGSPCASCSIRPLGGSAVAAVIPAICSALLLTSVVCPSLEATMIGRSVLSASSVALVASVPGGSIACRYQFTTCRNSFGPALSFLSRHVWMRDWNRSTVSAAYSRLQFSSC